MSTAVNNKDAGSMDSTLAQKPLRRLVLGPMNVPCDGTNTIAAGPWCFAGKEDFFPFWEEHFTLAPEPLADRELQKKTIGEALSLAADMVPRLAKRLQPERVLPPAYWETLLAPCCINVARILVELWYRAKAMVAAFGEEELEVELLPDQCTFSMGTDADVVLHGCLDADCLHWLLSQLLRPILPQCWHVTEGEIITREAPGRQPPSFREKMRLALRNLALRLPCPPLKGMPLAAALRCSLALLHKSQGPDRSRLLCEWYESRLTGARVDLPLDPLLIFLALLPESVRALEHPAVAPARMASPRTRIAHILLYEDAGYRQTLALWRARGGRLACVQHGGNYGMMRHISAMELVEYTQHAFVTWGWKRQESALGERCGEARFVPLPAWQLVTIRDSWRGGSDKLIFVGTEMPAVGYQLDSHPTPMQNLLYREDKQWFVEALGPGLQEHVLYRPYFAVPGCLDDAPWLLSRFARVHLCSGPLLPHLLSCKLLVLDHHGTTLLEAMAANVPTVCFWDSSCWPLGDDFARLVALLRTAGIWQASAEDAAVQVGKIWNDPAAWWRSDAVQAARKAFMDAFANAQKPHHMALWLGALHRL